MKNHKTFLECDHVGWIVNAILMTPPVFIMCVISVEWTPLRFLAGFTLGIWFSMWLVVVWAWLIQRRQTPDKLNQDEI